MTLGLLILVIFTAVFAMLAKRLASSVLTPPIAFIAFGFALSFADFFPQEEAGHLLHLVAEIALVILLFLDAAQTDMRALKKRHVWPVRMLAIGLPLSIALGVLLAWPFLPDWPIIAIALLAAILAPTDAALGQAVVTNPIVPERVRRALTVESGLNDGLALPAILLFASLAANTMAQSETNWLLFGAKQLVFGPLVGITTGLVGGTVLIWAKDRDFTSEAFEGIGAIAMAGAAYLGASAIDGNGFISAFVAGLWFGYVVKGRCKFVYEFAESEGLLLTWGAFFLLGVASLPSALAHLTWASLTVILLSLFVVRPVAIWISLLGTDASSVTRLFFGWFGPRGLATALFALLVAPQIDHELSQQIVALAINTVWISALLHGLSAQFGAKWYAAKINAKGDCAETKPVMESAKSLKTTNQ